MSLWQTRAGSHGEYEARFPKDGRICLGWGASLPDLRGAKNYDDVKKVVVDSFPEEGSRKLGNWARRHPSGTDPGTAIEDGLSKNLTTCGVVQLEGMHRGPSGRLDGQSGNDDSA